MKGDNLPEILSMVSLCFLWVGFVCGGGGLGGLFGWWVLLWFLVGGLVGWLLLLFLLLLFFVTNEYLEIPYRNQSNSQT